MASVWCLMQEDNMVDNISAFYRLTAVWLLMQVSPTYAQTGQLQLPLPAEAPVAFTALPVCVLPCRILGFRF